MSGTRIEHQFDVGTSGITDPASQEDVQEFLTPPAPEPPAGDQGAGGQARPGTDPGGAHPARSEARPRPPEAGDDEGMSRSRLRRERQRQARDRELNYVRQLEARVADLEQRHGEVGVTQLQAELNGLDLRFNEVRNRFQAAEAAIAQGATGPQLAAALNQKDTALEEARQISQRQELLQAKLQEPRVRRDVSAAPDGAASDPRRGNGGSPGPASPRAVPSTLGPEGRYHGQQFVQDYPVVLQDPNSEDARSIREIDDELASEGWNMNQRDYWDEFRRRVNEELPHLAASNPSSRPQGRQPAPPNNTRRGPPMAAAGRAPGSPAAHPLTGQRISALKEAGLWDDPKSRERMKKYYGDYDKVNGSAS